ncbi:MAG TPA: DUF1080 domain-containing protein [Anseongella sp.]
MRITGTIWAAAFFLASCTPGAQKENAGGDNGTAGEHAGHSASAEQAGEWVQLFNGESLDGWKVGESPETFSVENGTIKVAGPRAHLFYEGPVNNHEFKNFEFKAQVMTTEGSNSGIYFHTAYQESGWPEKGYEVQVNNSHTDWRRTGSLYGIDDVKDVLVKDNEWYTEHIIVRDKHIIVKINGETVVDYTEPDSVAQTTAVGGRRISSGTFALQGHDPESVVFYKDVQVKALP